MSNTARCVDHPDQSASHCLRCIAAAIPRPAYVVVPHTPRLRKRETKPQPDPGRTQAVRDRIDHATKDQP